MQQNAEELLATLQSKLKQTEMRIIKMEKKFLKDSKYLEAVNGIYDPDLLISLDKLETMIYKEKATLQSIKEDIHQLEKRKT